MHEKYVLFIKQKQFYKSRLKINIWNFRPDPTDVIYNNLDLTRPNPWVDGTRGHLLLFQLVIVCQSVSL